MYPAGAAANWRTPSRVSAVQNSRNLAGSASFASPTGIETGPNQNPVPGARYHVGEPVPTSGAAADRLPVPPASTYSLGGDEPSSTAQPRPTGSRKYWTLAGRPLGKALISDGLAGRGGVKKAMG